MVSTDEFFFDLTAAMDGGCRFIEEEFGGGFVCSLMDSFDCTKEMCPVIQVLHDYLPWKRRAEEMKNVSTKKQTISPR